MLRLLAAIVAASVTSPVIAADLPMATKAPAHYAPAPSWTGFYLGLNLGGGYKSDDMGIAGTDTAGSFAVATGLVPNTLATRGGGVIGGGQIGYNYQINGPLVIGIEADLQGSGIKGSDSQVLTAGPLGVPLSLTTTGSSELNWFGTVRGRLGVLLGPNTLIYGTGGLAYGSVKRNVMVSLNAPAPFGATAAFSSDSTQTGWTLGAGFEYRLAQNWTLGAEYLYLDLGDIGEGFGTTIGVGRGAVPVNFNATDSAKYQLGRFKLNYEFQP